MRKISIIVALCALAASAAAPVKTVFTVEPPMFCNNCENRIKGDIRFEKGVKDIRTDLEAGTVTISYDPAKTDTTRLKAAFKKIGYTATVQPDSLQ